MWGVTRTLQHAIEAEDTAHALLEFAGGSPGYLFASTAEAGVRLSTGSLTITRFQPAHRDMLGNSSELFAAPSTQVEEVRPQPAALTDHHAVYHDLLAAIAEGRPPRCDGISARDSLEVAKARALSSQLERPIDLPIDRLAYDTLLAEQRARA